MGWGETCSIRLETLLRAGQLLAGKAITLNWGIKCDSLLKGDVENVGHGMMKSLKCRGLHHGSITHLIVIFQPQHDLDLTHRSGCFGSDYHQKDIAPL